MGVRTVFSDAAIEDAILNLNRTMTPEEFAVKYGCEVRQLQHLIGSLRKAGANIPRPKRVVRSALSNKILNFKATHPGLFEELVNKNLPKNMQPRES